MRGIDPRTSRMRRERSSNWATSPNNIASMSFQNSKSDSVVALKWKTTSFYCLVSSGSSKFTEKGSKVLEMRGIDFRTSQCKASALPFELHPLKILQARVCLNIWFHWVVALKSTLPIFTVSSVVEPFFQSKNSKVWRCGASIPVPLACDASALPIELHPPTILQAWVFRIVNPTP